MTTWKRYNLSECCEIISGATPSTSVDAYWDGDICWATPKDLSDLDGHFISGTPRKLTEAGLSSCAATILPPNSVLFSSRAPIGHTAINTVPMATNQGFKSLIPRAELLDSKFLLHWLRRNRAFLEGLGVGATFKEVSKAIVSKVEIYLPALSEQRRIAAILDKADALRTKRREALTQLERLAQSIFVEMFGEGSIDYTSWPEVNLGDVADMITGYPFRSEEYVENSHDSIKLCRGANVLPNRLDWGDTVYWPLDKLNGLEGFSLTAGDIVIAMDRPWISEGFKISIVPERDIPALLVQRVARLRGKDGVENSYLYALLRQPGFTRHCKPTETTVPHISPKDIRTFQFRLPAAEYRQKFVALSGKVSAKISSHMTALTESESLFASLQHRAFRGEL